MSPALHRFFVEDAVAEDDVALRGATARQIAAVLRLTPGDRIVLVHAGDDIEVKLGHVSPSEVRGRVVDRHANSAEPARQLTLAVPILKSDRSEEVVEAVTQLGVARIVPFVSARSVVRDLSAPKRRRWEQIARESAETARRGRVPRIEATATWAELFETLEPPIVVAWEGETSRQLNDLDPNALELSLVIGPEGGFGEDEVALARDRGATIVSLGPRNLRSETAAIAAVAVLLSGAGRKPTPRETRPNPRIGG